MPIPSRSSSLVLVATLILTGCSNPTSPQASVPGSAPPLPTPTLPASQAPSAAPTNATGWHPVPDQDSVRGAVFDDVVWTGTRFVATATVPEGDGLVLDSSDGLTWHSQPLVGLTGAPISLAAGPSGIVAIGAHDGGHNASGFSADGLTWTTRIDAFGRPSGTDSLQVTAAVAMDGGWLAVGREDPFCNHNCGLAPVRARAWTSRNGLDWTSVSAQPSLAGGAMLDVTRGGSGFVAVGLVGTRAAAWTSADGVTWTRARDAAVFHARPSDDPALWTVMTSVAYGHGALMAVGTDGNGGAHGPQARAWWSADGHTWTEATGERFEGFISGQNSRVIATRDGFLAVFATYDTTCPSGLWGSTDGQAWQCASADPAFADFVPSAAAESSTIRIVVGYGRTITSTPDGPLGAVWWQPLP